MNWWVDHGECREVMAAMPSMTVDAIVCDPPYDLTSGKRGGTGAASLNVNSPAGRARIGTGFMGKAWDGSGVAFDPATWAACLRILKPGGHLLAFGGTRTSHRMVCAIEDAGFEIRDTIAWMYGSGFPKSLNVGKAIDKAAGAQREVIGRNPNHRDAPDVDARWNNAVLSPNVTAPATSDAACWEGWGTALKPAFEPIVVARKPLIGTVAANVRAHGTGALNVDACRIEHSEECRTLPDQHGSSPGNFYRQGGRHGATLELKPAGRWPANVVLDPEAGAALDEQTGILTSGSGPLIRSADKFGRNTYGNFKGTDEVLRPGGSGGASRFFYCAKAGSSERAAGLSACNTHPTVKPIALMRWLVRLVTPPDGLVLDPFAGSGTTGIACVLEGFGFHGIEREAEYVAIAHARIAHWAPVEPPQLSMEGLDAP